MVLRKHYVYKYKCAICDKLFKDVWNLVVHVKAHEGEQIYKCRFCEKLFISSAQFNKHLMKHSNQAKKYSCNVCLQTFCTYIKLKHHTKRHGKPYFCNKCEQSFHTSSQLQQHLCKRGTEFNSLHNTQVSPIVDDEYNEVDLDNDDNDVSDAASLENVFTGVLDSDADDAKVITDNDKSDHIVTHLEEKCDMVAVYQCCVCQTRFDCNRTLRKHLETHNSEIMVVHLAFDNVNDGNQTECNMSNDQSSPVQNRKYINGQSQTHEQNEVFGSEMAIDHNYSFQTVMVKEEKQNEFQNFVTFNECSLAKEMKTDDIVSDHCDTIMDAQLQDICMTNDCIPENEIKLENTGIHNLMDDFITNLDKGCNLLKEKLSNEESVVLPVRRKRTNRCYVCFKTFQNQSKLEKHSLIHSNDDEHKCGVSKALFKDESSLSHLQKVYNRKQKGNQSKEGPFLCSFCNKCFKRKEYLIAHTKLHTNDPMSCSICGKEFRLRKILNSHMKTHTEEKSHKCSECEKCFLLATNLQRHKQIHSDERPFECELCSKTFRNKDALNKHCKGVHSDNNKKTSRKQKPFKGPFLCNICNKSFKTKDYLNVHNKMHTNDPIFCSICGKEFRLRRTLNSHMKTHTEEKSHQCSECGKCFLLATNLQRHLRVHSDDRPFVCELCSKRFKDKESLIKHCKGVHLGVKRTYLCKICKKVFKAKVKLNDHHDKVHNEENTDSLAEKKCICMFCAKEFSGTFSLKMHEDRHRRNQMFQCEICQMNLSSKVSLTDHINSVHSELRPFSCDICQKSFKRKRYMLKHKEIHTAPSKCSDKTFLGPFLCSICNKYFKGKSNFIVHKKMHTNDPMSCSICGKEFRLRKILNSHMKTHTEEKSHKCSECGKCFLLATHLKRHLFIHRDERPFMCEVCGKGFKDVSTLANHIEIHSTNRQTYACEFCNREFTSRVGLNSHVMGHTGLRPFLCSFCPMAFKVNETLKEHERIHTGDKPYSCPHCPKRFGSKSAFNDHKLVHTDNRPFPCDQCSLSFKQKEPLKRHVKNVHLKLREFACQFCTKDFRRSDERNRHVAKFHNFVGEQTVDMAM